MGRTGGIGGMGAGEVGRGLHGVPRRTATATHRVDTASSFSWTAEARERGAHCPHRSLVREEFVTDIPKSVRDVKAIPNLGERSSAMLRKCNRAREYLRANPSTIFAGTE
jgi:hypothetical protein